MTWDNSTTFNAQQVFTLLFAFFDPNSQGPIPQNPIWGDLNSLSSNQKNWISWSVFSPVMMQGDMWLPLMNALDNIEALR